MNGFSGKVAAITGAGSGMGRSLAVELARRGCEVALADVDETGLAGTAAACAQHGVRVSTRRLDVADARRLDRIARLLGAGYQRLMLRHVRRARTRNLQRAHAPAARPTTPTKDPV
ncbi:hypothetical protein WT26_22975 [Burkholderia cepacia]|uniref:SDR family NAD(P)-dependent oxidoreductase n=1 Tax=Burkholderia cepacia TaxID=292 RepID=A0A1B4PY70_BURCE|nr:SDR family NAD(P)-dependent oxidoreductase [Burkholderia cepacia]AOK18858.1 hypothetical protein WT26_22975 [Burkholderia cepacia]